MKSEKQLVKSLTKDYKDNIEICKSFLGLGPATSSPKNHLKYNDLLFGICAKVTLDQQYNIFNAVIFLSNLKQFADGRVPMYKENFFFKTPQACTTILEIIECLELRLNLLKAYKKSLKLNTSKHLVKKIEALNLPNCRTCDKDFWNCEC